MMSIIVYTVGGPDNLVLHLSSGMNSMESDHIIFPIISYFLWIIFIIAMSVLFLNLLVGQHTMCVHTYMYGLCFGVYIIVLCIWFMSMCEY